MPACIHGALLLQDGQVIECSQVSDVRKGSVPKVRFFRSLDN